MISRNESILLDMIKSLENIKNEFITRQVRAYDAHLERLDLLVELALARVQANAIFDKNPIVKCVMQIIQQIEGDIHQVEIEMNGVENYSPDQQKRIEDLIYKQVIKDDLANHLQILAHARQDVRHHDFSDIVKMLS